MTKLVKPGLRSGIVISLAAAAMIAPQITMAGPGCMNSQRMVQGYYPYRPMGPQMAYGQMAPSPYYPVPHAAMMASPYNQPMTAQQIRPAVNGKPAMPSVVTANAEKSSRVAAGSKDMPSVESVTVRINGMRFEPANITVKPGTTVTWLQGSQMPHTISGDAEGLRSNTLYQGQKYSHTFNATGSYKYFCDLHPSMTGSVVVQEADS